MSFAENVLRFYTELRIDHPLPRGVQILNPYQDDQAFAACKTFYNKFYNDNRKRFLILGINPGRHGAGLTGIPFVDPAKLESLFGIKNNFPKKTELSADFIHAMIAGFGGHEKFFSKFFINSVSPLGFMKDGKNLNYYDTPLLKKSLEPFIYDSMQRLLDFNVDRRISFCLGEGANFKYLADLNTRHKFFEHIVPLAHPRFIMQYKRRQLNGYLEDYLQKLNSAC
jgi:hypothetical protein